MVTKREIIDLAQNLGIAKIGFTSIDGLSDVPTGKILDVAELKGVLDIFPSAKSVIVVA